MKYRSQGGAYYWTYLKSNGNNIRRQKKFCQYFDRGFCVFYNRHCTSSHNCETYSQINRQANVVAIKDISTTTIQQHPFSNNKHKEIYCVPNQKQFDTALYNKITSIILSNKHYITSNNTVVNIDYSLIKIIYDTISIFDDYKVNTDIIKTAVQSSIKEFVLPNKYIFDFNIFQEYIYHHSLNKRSNDNYKGFVKKVYTNHASASIQTIKNLPYQVIEYVGNLKDKEMYNFFQTFFKKEWGVFETVSHDSECTISNYIDYKLQQYRKMPKMINSSLIKTKIKRYTKLKNNVYYFYMKDFVESFL
jgi:hypothetical protein